MPRPKGVNELELLRRKQAEIGEQVKAAEARQRERLKLQEARRKELLGAIVSEYLRTTSDTPLAKSLFDLVAKNLTRPADRALFPELTHRAGPAETRVSSTVPEPVENS